MGWGWSCGQCFASGEPLLNACGTAPVVCVQRAGGLSGFSSHNVLISAHETFPDSFRDRLTPVFELPKELCFFL